MKCKEGVEQLFQQISATIDLIPDDVYYGPLEIFNGSTFGKHFRHIYDFFHCLTMNCSKTEVDYAARERDQRVENEKSYALLKFSELKEYIEVLDESEPIKVYADFDDDPKDRTIVMSTVGRELMYAYDHAVHHLAIIKIGLRNIVPPITIDDSIGVAASTLQHQYELNHGH